MCYVDCASNFMLIGRPARFYSNYSLEPVLAYKPIMPKATALGLALVIYLPHKFNRRMNWFHGPENLYDMHFTLSRELIVLFTCY
jgi:hypothetical protein